MPTPRCKRTRPGVGPSGMAGWAERAARLILVGNPGPQVVLAVLEAVEQQAGMRVANRLARSVGQQILFGDIGGVGAALVLGQQVVEGLVLAGADFFGDRQPPFLGVRERRVDVEDHTPERQNPVADHLADHEFGESSIHDRHNDTGPLTGI